MVQPGDSEKHAILAQILQSQGFKESKRYQDLLQYLVEKSSAEMPPKETEIAQAVFGKDSGFDPTTDPLIRSYVSNLRKKLNHYYLTTEDKCEYVLEIPKGHYVVEYEKAAHRRKAKKLRERLSGLYPALAVLLLILTAVLIYRDFTHRNSSSSARSGATAGPLWREFLKPDARPTLIVLGDFFFMRERGNSDGYYRKGRINNLDEYLEYIRKNPGLGQRFTKNNFTYLRPSASWGLMHLLPILWNAPGGISLKLASQFTPDDFKNNNVVFVGSFKTLYVLRNFLDILKLDYSTVPPSSFRIQDGIGDSLHTFRPERLSAGNLEKDYGVVAKGPGPDGSCIMMMLGFSESGVIQAAMAASDPSLIESVVSLYPPGTPVNPAAITLVIGAEGMAQSLYSGDVEYMAGAGPPEPKITPAPKNSASRANGR
jgi:hypothetical protein